MERVRVGMIGVGGWGAGGHMQAYRDSPHAEVVAVCDALAERARQVAGEWGVENAVADYRELLALAGTGTLGDTGIHSADLVRWWLSDETRSVVGRMTTFRKQRPTVAASATMPSLRDAIRHHDTSVEMAPVDVDDEATWLATFEGGA